MGLAAPIAALTVFDWLSNMSLPTGQAPCVEVRFKNGRKEFYRNTEKLTLSMGDIVATVLLLDMILELLL
jgi:hypothetical protein